ncbi:MAG: GmrSD restriction endonuclease domain-containing protein [Nocardioidaceae bacterium]
MPVENAWVSGAWRWTKATRIRFYNDLGDSRTLVAVDQHDNEAKGDQDPTRWMPAYGHCRYIRYWVAVKIRWHLSVTRAEKAKLAQVAAGCANTRLIVRKAVISYR